MMLNKPIVLRNMIVLEGTDGAGKTTIIRDMCNHVRLAKRIIHFKFPYDGNQTRFIVSTKRTIKELEETASPSEKVRERIQHLKDSVALAFAVDQLMGEAELLAHSPEQVIVCDRGWLSNLAYQAPNVSPQVLELLTQLAYNRLLWPGHIIYLDVDPTVGIQRVVDRAGKGDVWPSAVKYLEKVQYEYKDHLYDISQYGNGVCVYRVNANQSLERTYSEVHSIVEGITSLWEYSLSNA